MCFWVMRVLHDGIAMTSLIKIIKPLIKSTMNKFPTEKPRTWIPNSTSEEILTKILLEMELPNCFGLYGNWWSWKTTILFWIKHLIEQKQDIKCIYFEAWKYEYAKEWDLMYALLQEIKKSFWIKNRKRWYKRLWISILTIFSWLLNKWNILKLEDVIHDFKVWEEKMYSEEEDWVDKIEEFRSLFRSVIIRELNKRGIQKLIILVDDLDRCLPENSVKLIESIKNFLSVEKTLFVFAIDQRITSEMIEKKYDIHGWYGSEYLLKIIPYYYELPTTDLGTEIKDILLVHDIDIPEREIAFIKEFFKEFAPEPRVIKNYLHQIGIIVNLSPKIKTSCLSDEINIYYLLVSLFLLKKFAKYFSVPTKERNRRITWFGSEVRSRGSRTSFNEGKLDDIEESDREKIHAIYLSRKEQQYGHMAPEKIEKTMNLLKDFL